MLHTHTHTHTHTRAHTYIHTISMLVELVMFSCINVSFVIIEYKFVFVRSPCFKCSFCPRRFTTIIYSASFTSTSPTIALHLWRKYEFIVYVKKKSWLPLCFWNSLSWQVGIGWNFSPQPFFENGAVFWFLKVERFSFKRETVFVWNSSGNFLLLNGVIFV